MAKQGLTESGQVLASPEVRQTGHFSTSHMICRFHQYYPGEYVNSAYPTRDKVIPYPRFLMLMREVGSLEARKRAGAVIELTTATGIFEGDKKTRTRSREQLMTWIREGWPEQG